MKNDISLPLEDIAYLAGAAETVDDLRRLDLLLRATLTYVESRKAADADKAED